MATKVKKNGGSLQFYKSYNFREKDPVIDKLRTLIADHGAKYSEIQADSGVSTTTLYNWFKGTTRKPQFATVMAVTRSLDCDLEIVDRASGTRYTLPTARTMTRSAAAVKRYGATNAGAVVR